MRKKSNVSETGQDKVKGKKRTSFSPASTSMVPPLLLFSASSSITALPVSPHAPPLLVHLENAPHADTKVTFHQVQSNTLCNIYRCPPPFPSSASSSDPFGMKVLRRWMMPLNFITAFPFASSEFCRGGFHCSFSATGCILPDLFEAALWSFENLLEKLTSRWPKWLKTWCWFWQSLNMNHFPITGKIQDGPPIIENYHC